MSVAPSPVSVRSCACALVVASSAIASKVLRNTCDASGLAGAECTSRLHVRRKSVVNHAISIRVRRGIAVVVSASECGDGGDAMGWSRVCELRDALRRQP
jgi:hypothetical protein